MTAAPKRGWAQPVHAHETRELRRIAKAAGYLPGLDAVALEDSLTRVFADIGRCRKVKAWLRWVLNVNALAAVCVTIFALYAHEFAAPYGLACVAIGFIFVVAVKHLERVDRLHAQLIEDCNDLSDALHQEDTKILAWSKTRKANW